MTLTRDTIVIVDKSEVGVKSKILYDTTSGIHPPRQRSVINKNPEQGKMNMKVKVVNKSKHDLPSYETSGAAGMDVRANLDAPMTHFIIPAGDTKLIPTGLFVAIPEGYEIQVRPRSGISFKTKLRVANSPGTIDSCYRGEIKVIMTNTGDVDHIIQDGERIAQLVLCPVIRCEWDKVDSENELGETDRGAGGFGSTGS